MEVVIRFVIDRVRRRPSQDIEGIDIFQDRLHGRSRLLRLGCRIAAGGISGVLTARSHCDDLAVGVVDQRQTGIEILIRECVDLTVGNVIGELLRFTVDAGIDVHRCRVRIHAGQFACFLYRHLHDALVWIFREGFALLQLESQIGAGGQIIFFLADVAVLQHQLQGLVATGRSQIVIIVRAVRSRGVDDAGQEGTL